MSYKDLRSLTEMMRALGYPRLISLENFRQPNFGLVAEMMIWLVKRFEPNADLPTELDTEQDRVILVRSVVQFMANKAHIKLNPKKLYQADGYAVKELIKVTSVLYNAMKGNSLTSGDDETNDTDLPTFDIGSKLSQLKQTRKLGSKITMKGATLYDLLGKEIDLREKRQAVLAKNLEIQDVEVGLRNSIKMVDTEIKKVQHNIENVQSNESALDAKIEKKKVELDRNQKRLLTLKKVRPAFMDEYEKLEVELKKCYDEYMLRFRSLTYLEQQIDEFERVEQERMEERQNATRKIIERMKQDENTKASEDMLSDGEDLDDTEDEEDEVVDTREIRVPSKPEPEQRRPGKSARNRPAGPNSNRRVYGSMTGGEDDDSLDSDSDMLLDEDSADSEELEVNEMAAAELKNRKSAKAKLVTQAAENSDGDF